jgi:hypothetical protein
VSHRGFAAFSFVLVGACASGPDSAPARVDEFNTWVERVQVESELARVRVAEAAVQLQTLSTNDHGGDGAIAVYGRFVQAVDAAEAQAKQLASVLTPMKSVGEKVFVRWEKDVAAIAGERLRERSQARLELARERYDAVLTAAEPALLEFVRMNRTMRDIALFLASDLNVGALAAIHDDVRDVLANAERLDLSFEQSLLAARAYVESAALPAEPPAEPPAAPAPAPTPAPSR